MKVVLNVGHSLGSGGACNENSDINEFEFNTPLAAMISNTLMIHYGIDVYIVNQDEGDYSGLPAKINALTPDLVVSLHANAYNKETEGCEVLFCNGSAYGERLATIACSAMSTLLDNNKRGSFALNKGDRGYYLLHGVVAPAVLLEPFFIDNDEDLAGADSVKQDLANIIAHAIYMYGKAYHDVSLPITQRVKDTMMDLITVLRDSGLTPVESATAIQAVSKLITDEVESD